MNLIDFIDRKRSPIQFSWHGNCECFERYSTPLLDGINKNPLTWKHDDNYPININFKSKFVKFNEGLVLSAGVPPFSSRIAFIHIYFFNSASVDEYKSALPEFAEWFLQVKNGSWIVVFDSTRAREQKNRGHVMEKIKSDVSGSQNRIFEVNNLTDTKSLTTLTNSIISNFTLSLDHYSNAIKSVILTLKDDRNIMELINAQFKLCFFYWSIGMMENALSEIDDLDSIIRGMFSDASVSLDEKNLVALTSLKSVDGRNYCPLLLTQMKRNEVERGDSLITLKAFVLAHQILAGLFSYNLRCKNGDALTLNSLNNFFASSLFQNTYNLLDWLKNNLFLKESIYDKFYQNCLTILWTNEIFEFSKCYGNFMELETSTEHSSKLQIMNSEAWLFLKEKEVKKSEWLNLWNKVLGNSEVNSTIRDQFLAIQSNKCFDYCLESLKLTVQILKNSKWHRNFIVFHLRLAKLSITNGDKRDLLEAIEEILPILSKANLPISFIYLQLKQCVDDPTEVLQSNPKLLSKFNSYLSNVILKSPISEETPIVKRTSFKLFNFEVGSAEDNRFPFRLLSIHPSFIVVRLNKPFKMSVNLHSAHAIPLNGCQLKAIFKPLNPKTVYFTSPSFESIMQENGRILRLQCVNDGLDKKMVSKRIANLSLYEPSDTDLECNFTGNQTKLIVGQNRLEFEATPNLSSNFVLSHLSIKHPSGFEFILSVEHEKINSQISGCFCFVDIKMPNVELKDNPKTKLYAGIAQELTLCLHSGSIPILNQSNLKAYFLDSEGNVEFMNEGDNWKPELESKLPSIDAMSEHLLKIRFCTSIDKMNYSVMDNFSFARTLKVEWQGREWTFELQFTSILSVKTMTSILEDRALFESEIARCDGNDRLLIVPLEANMTSVNEENGDFLKADLLNDCLEQIYADSTYRFIWKLPQTPSNNGPVNHHLQIKYKIQPNEDYDQDISTENEMHKIICRRDYLFQDTISFSIPRVEYEICARILSEKPQSVICRAESTCDFVISLRMLTKNNAETVIVALEADPENWNLIEKFKVVQIKENGLGQTSFSVVPKVGFLPYPSVFIHRFNNSENTSEKDLTSLNESKLFGERVMAFNRSEAKQIHVLGAFNPVDDTDSLHSASSGLKSFRAQAKERLQRLFES